MRSPVICMYQSVRPAWLSGKVQNQQGNNASANDVLLSYFWTGSYWKLLYILHRRAWCCTFSSNYLNEYNAIEVSKGVNGEEAVQLNSLWITSVPSVIFLSYAAASGANLIFLLAGKNTPIYILCC